MPGPPGCRMEMAVSALTVSWSSKRAMLWPRRCKIETVGLLFLTLRRGSVFHDDWKLPSSNMNLSEECSAESGSTTLADCCCGSILLYQVPVALAIRKQCIALPLVAPRSSHRDHQIQFINKKRAFREQ